MNKHAVFKYILFSIIPLIIAKGAIFLANIVSANRVSVEHFLTISEVYLCAAIISTPIIGVLNQYISIIGERLGKIIIVVLIMSLFSSFFATLYYVYFFSDSSVLINAIAVSFFTFIIILSGGTSAIFIGSGVADKLNSAAVAGGILFLLLTFLFMQYELSWHYYLLLYIAIPLTNTVISPILLKNNVHISITPNTAKIKVICKLLLITILGAPVQLYLIAVLKASDMGEIATLNIAYQWHMLVIILPTMLSSILLKFLTAKKAEVKSIYKNLSYIIASFIALIIIVISDFAEGLYGANGVGVASVIRVYAIAGILSVLYHVKLNTFLSELLFNHAIKLVALNAFVYLFVGWLGLLYFPTTLTLALSMSLSYGLTLIFAKIFLRLRV